MRKNVVTGVLTLSAASLSVGESVIRPMNLQGLGVTPVLEAGQGREDEIGDEVDTAKLEDISRRVK